MKLHLNSVTPSHQDIAVSSIVALCVVILGNAYQGLNYYIFRPANRPTPQTTHDLLIAVLGRVDTYQPTQTIVTFLFWGIVGLAIVALWQGLAHTLRRIRYISYISAQGKYRSQPRPISLKVFWKHVICSSIGTFIALSTALFIFSFFVLCIAPVGVVYARVFMYAPTPFNLVYAMMGICLTFIGLVLAAIGVRLIFARRRLIRLA